MNENEHNLAKTRYQAPQSKPPMNNPTNTLRTSNTQMRALTERCPWCDSAISHSRFAEIEVKIRQQEQLKLAESSKQLRAQLEAEHATELTRQRQHNEQQLQTLLKAKLKEVDAEQQKLFADQRAAMEKDRDESAPGDRVIRVPKGQPGADIQVEVTHKGQPCGKIIAECKNTKAWQNSFIEKLRQDQMAAGAEHAVLATTVFPRPERYLGGLGCHRSFTWARNSYRCDSAAKHGHDSSSWSQPERARQQNEQTLCAHHVRPTRPAIPRGRKAIY
jgi:hypothetical protein